MCDPNSDTHFSIKVGNYVVPHEHYTDYPN